MAYTIEQKPNLISAANSPMVFVLKEDSAPIYNAPKFRYIVQIFVSSTDYVTFEEKAKLKIYKNRSNVGIVDISKIVRTYLTHQKTNVNSTSWAVHTIGIKANTKNFGVNSQQLKIIKVQAGYEKSTTSTTAPEETLNEASYSTFSMPATTPFTNTATNKGGLDIDAGQYPLGYFLNNTSSPDDYSFLTNAPNIQFVRGSSTAADNVDELTICFKQGASAPSLLTDGAKIQYIGIEYFDGLDNLISGTSGGLNVHFFKNVTTNGGATMTQALDVAKSLLYFGCGTANLEAQSGDVEDSSGSSVAAANARPSNFSNWAYYRIFGSIDHTTADRSTKYYYFYRYGAGRKGDVTGVDDRHQSCTRHDNIRLAWVNRLGAWDYMNFRGKSVESMDIKRSTSATVPGTWDATTFDYNNWDKGKNTLFTEATRRLTINSDWLNEDEGVWLEELFTSPDVQILADNNVVYPVLITDKKYIKKTSVNNKIKIQYRVNLEYAHNVRTNS
tara:strand:- start:6139 stop:7638 length:1500 start_codon:yes stop_codon:yes gene_type:complete